MLNNGGVGETCRLGIFISEAIASVEEDKLTVLLLPPHKSLLQRMSLDIALKQGYYNDPLTEMCDNQSHRGPIHLSNRIHLSRALAPAIEVELLNRE